MKKPMFLAAFMLSAFAWAGAQQPGGMPAQGGSQGTTPDASQSQSATPGAAAPSSPQASPQAGASGSAMSGSVTEGCLGGTNPNFTLTDSAGKSYKLNLPPNADGSRLTPHVGESIQVMGDVRQSGGASSIDVNKVGKGSGTCPGK